MSDLVRMSISLEPQLFAKLESLVADSEYKSRSEFVRDLIRRHVVDRNWRTNELLLGTISLVYDHHTRGLGERLTHQQHHFSENAKVLATTHVHLDEHLCAEMIMVRGRARDIQVLADRLGREKGVLHARLATGTTGKELL